MEEIKETEYDGVEEEEEREEPGGFERHFSKLLIACSVLLAGELIWLFAINPCMPLSSIEISGIDSLSRTAVIDAAGINSRTSYFTLDAAKAVESLLLIPQVESVEITKKFPDSVSIILKSRTAVAVSLAGFNREIVPVLIDKDGVVFHVGSKGIEIENDLPILSGLVFENVTAGMTLPDFLLPLLRSMKELEENAPGLISAISEVHINMRMNESFDLTLYPQSVPVKIRVGPELSAEKISTALVFLDIFMERRIDADEIDYRTGTASYKTREQEAREAYSG